MDAEAGKQRCFEGTSQAEMGKQQFEDEEEDDGEDHLKCSTTKSGQDKQDRIKLKKGKGAVFEEDVIDGFAILSFTTLNELETVTKRNGCVKGRPAVEESACHKDHNLDELDSRDKKRRAKKVGSMNHCISNCLDGGDVGDSSCSISSDNGCSVSAHSDCSISSQNSCSIGSRSDCSIGSHIVLDSISSHNGLPSPGVSNHNGLPSPKTRHHNGLPSPKTSNHNGLPSPKIINHNGLSSPKISNHNGLPSPKISNHNVLPSPHASNHNGLPSPNVSNHNGLPSPNASNHNGLTSPNATPEASISNITNGKAGLTHDMVTADDHHPHSNSKQDSPLPTSHDRLSDFDVDVDVDVGDDKVSEPGSTPPPGSIVGGFLTHLPASQQNPCVTYTSQHPCVAYSVPTPPPSTSTTPTDPFPTLVQQILLVATTTPTTTTVHTTTRSPTKPGISDSLVTTTSTTSQSVISPQAYPHDNKGSNPACPYNRPPSPHQLHHSDSGDNSTCARSLQYSRLHKPSPTQGGKTKDSTQHHSPSNPSSNLLHHPDNTQHTTPDNTQHTTPDNTQHTTPDNHRPQHPHNGANNLNHHTASRPVDQTNTTCPLNGHPTGPGPHSPHHQRLDHVPSSHIITEKRHDRANDSSSALVSNTVVQAINTDSNPAVKSAPRSQDHHSTTATKHHQRTSSSSSRAHQHTSHHNHPSRDHIRSPLAHPPKRVCRTPPTPTTSLSDASKHFSSHFPSWPQAGSRLGGLSVHLPNPKDSADKYSHPDDRNSSIGSYHSHHLHNHQHHTRQPHREERDSNHPAVSQGAPVQIVGYPAAKTAWPNSPGHLYSPLIQHLQHSPLTPTSSSSSLLHHTLPPSLTSHTSLFPHPLVHSPSLHTVSAPSLSTGMFAPSIHHTPHSLSSTAALPSHPALSSQLPSESLLRGQDYLHQDLNNRLLAHHDPSPITLPSSSPFVRSETHQHQHLHNHMHQHTYGGLGNDPLVPQVGPLFDKIPKSFEAGVFRPSFEKIPKAFDPGMFVPNIVPSYSAAFASLLPAIRSGTAGLQGAFQPKGLATAGQMFLSFRDREKTVQQPGLPPLQKKHGKWCSVHVRVAWEIFHRQQKKIENDADLSPYPTSSSKPGIDSKPLEPLLRPAGHLLPGGVAPPRTPESSLLSSMARGYPDGNTSSSFMSSAAQLGLPHLSRSSPYASSALLNPLSFSGLGGGVFAADMAPQGLASSSSPHDWARLHRTSGSFPSWSRSDAEREKDRERDLRKEEESYRDRRSATGHNRSSFDDVRITESSRPRSRSRSPLVNGRLDLHGKPDMGHYDKRPLSASSSVLVLKEEDLTSLSHHLAERERRERAERERMDNDRLEKERIGRERLERERTEKEKMLQSAAAAEREKLLHAVEQRDKYLQSSGYLGLNSFGTILPPHPGLFDRRMGLMGHPTTAYPFLDRPPVPTSLWGPFDKSAELAHRLELERERERITMMSRLSGIPSHLAAVEQERLREHLLREHHEQEFDIHRHRVDRLPSFNSDRLRSVDHLSLGSYFPRTMSPMFGPVGLAGLKNSSPHGMPPPPLIHSSSAVAGSIMSRSHDNSPSSTSRCKGLSPADSTSDLKDKRDGGHQDPDTHNR